MPDVLFCVHRLKVENAGSVNLEVIASAKMNPPEMGHLGPNTSLRLQSVLLLLNEEKFIPNMSKGIKYPFLTNFWVECIG